MGKIYNAFMTIVFESRSFKRNERLEDFIREVALQAAILLVERHVVKRNDEFSEASQGRIQQNLVTEFSKLLNSDNHALAIMLFAPQAVSSSDRNTNFYENAAQKLADIGERLWKKKTEN